MRLVEFGGDLLNGQARARIEDRAPHILALFELRGRLCHANSLLELCVSWRAKGERRLKIVHLDVERGGKALFHRVLAVVAAHTEARQQSTQPSAKHLACFVVWLAQQSERRAHRVKALFNRRGAAGRLGACGERV